MNRPSTVLFDMDGTLLDTAPDLAYTLNQLRLSRELPELPFSSIRPTVSHGVKAMLKLAFNIDNTHADYAHLSQSFLEIYQQHATNATRLFPDMDSVLEYLEINNIPWGIVTNKPSRFTFDILKNLDLEYRASCIVCGDTLPKCKPDPDPILFACETLKLPTDEGLFIGDSHIDIRASKAAGMPALVALYGYISNDEDPFSWKADGYIRNPKDILTWLKESPQR